MGEYCSIVTSKRWETTDIKGKYQDEHLPLNFSTGEIEHSVIKNSYKADLKSLHSAKDNDYGGESFTKSVATFQKCGQKGHIKGIWESSINGSDEDSSEMPTINLPKWVTKKPTFQMWNI